MERVTENLTKFATELQFSDLPQEIIHETKYVLLDSIGAMILGQSTEAGKIALEVARRLGGPAESSVIGTSDKLSCTNAAFANAQLMNAIDYDAISMVHDVPYLISPPLALAETVRTSGKNLLVSIALALEISKRISLATPTFLGMSASAFGAAAGAARILNLGKEKTPHAIGLAGYLCPPDTMAKWTGIHPSPMAHYGLPGWGANAGVVAALLAQKGFTGDTQVFEGELCYWRYTGKTEWNSDTVIDDLGKTWMSKGIIFKPWPCGL